MVGVNDARYASAAIRDESRDAGHYGRASSVVAADDERSG
jgi:hypothetical protein